MLCCLQILGSIFGSMIYAGLIPGLRIGATHFSGEAAPGCFGPSPGVTDAALFWWEVRDSIKLAAQHPVQAVKLCLSFPGTMARWQLQALSWQPGQTAAKATPLVLATQRATEPAG
jgi:hypothetical protein